METQETQILTKIIENFISNNLDLVQSAQTICKKILDYGFIDSTTLPFQIVPTEMFDSSGNIICKLFINMEHPMYGFFQIDFYNEKCGVTCPQIYRTNYFVSTHQELEKWIDFLNEEMDDFYKLSNAVEDKNVDYCQLTLNDLLSRYKNVMKDHIKEIKTIIYKNPCTAIATGNIFALATEAKKDFSKALLHPKAWVVFKDENNLPDPEENINDYIDDELTEELQNHLNGFFRTESFYAAQIYLAQRICLQGGLNVIGFSITESWWQNAKADSQLGEYVLPPIDIKEFKVEM
jgi:hypothetical protein